MSLGLLARYPSLRLFVALTTLLSLQWCEQSVAGEVRAGTPELIDIRDHLKGFATDRCGPLALGLCARVLDVTVSDGDIGQWLQIADEEKGATVAELATGAQRLGLMTMLVQWADRPAIPHRTPAILPVLPKGVPHFIVVTAAKSDRFFVVDYPTSGWMSLDKIREHYRWNGYALHCTDSYWSMAWLSWLVYRRQIVLGSVVVTVIATVLFRWRRRRTPPDAGMPQGGLNLKASLFMTLVTGAVYGCGRPTTENVPAPIRMEPSKLSLSVADAGCTTEKCTAKLTIVNGGASPLKIEEVTGSCQCTAVGTPSKLLIAPGESVDIPITVRMPEHGQTTAKVNAVVVTGDVRHRLSSLVILSGVPLPVPHLIDCPREIEVRWSGKGEATASFYIRTTERRGSDYWIQSVKAGSLGAVAKVERLDVEESDIAEPDAVKRNYSYRASLTPASAPQGMPIEPEHLNVIASDSPEPKSVIALRITTVNRVRAVPASVYFNLDSPEPAKRSRRITILFDDPTLLPATITAQSSAEWLEVAAAELVRGEKRTHGVVDLRVRPEFNDSGLTKQSTVEVKATTEGGETFEKTISVTLRASHPDRVQTPEQSKPAGSR